MRRTYRSKKDTSEALDHKDVLLTLDEKSSVFDAFYIQNIKQTKKEMSSVHLHAGYNKVRKRKKYVKRIVKDVEPVYRDSVLESVYLTPNKSLHVNKPLDPFDLLLNSPSTIRNHCSRDNNDIFGKIRKEGKTYTRRVVAKIKKYNYSSSDNGESDKENSKNETKETSNIKMHQLLIEKDDKISPNRFDRSINDLVQKFTVLKKSDMQSTPGRSSDFNFVRNRLTTNIQSPILHNSPLCSTPLKEKYRGASIYNFSPINFAERQNRPDTFDESKIKYNNKKFYNEIENVNVRNDDKNLPDECLSFSLPSTSIEKQNDKTVVTEASVKCIKSPAISSEICKNVRNVVVNDGEEFFNHMSIDMVTNEKVPRNCNDNFATQYFKDKTENEINFIGEKEPLITLPLKKSTGIKLQGSCDGENATYVSNNLDNTDKRDSRGSNSICEEELNIISVVNVTDKKKHYNCEEQNSKEKSDSLFTNSMRDISLGNVPAVDKQIHKKIKDSKVYLTSDSNDNHCDNLSSIEISTLQTTELEPFLGFLLYNQKTELNKEVDNNDNNSEILVNVPCHDENSCNEGDIKKSLDSKLSKSKISLSDKSINKSIILCKIVKRDKDIDNSFKPDDSRVDDITVSSHEQSDDCGTSMSSQYDMSMYDTCDSSQSFQNTGDIFFTKEPVVVLKRMNDSTFRRYYKKIDESETEEFNCSYPDSERYASFDESSTGNLTNYLMNDSVDNNYIEENHDLNVSSVISDETNVEADLNDYTEEDRCISFVTTRRRNEITNDSMIFDFNDSYDSKSSLDCNKTVLSNNKISIRTNDDVAADIEDGILVNDSPVKETIELTTTEQISQCPNLTTSLSNVMPKTSSRTSESSVIASTVEPCGNLTREMKPSIVLQPGKKWERSLSIYRRMTMMTDHFDHSILDDEPLHCKGRKYRQSVISTMEMQDFRDSLQNDSLISRRSTFVSKPCRSNIKIVKEPNSFRLSLSTSTVFDDLKGFLNEDCDDTIVELSKLSIADSEHEVTVLENFHDTAGRVSTPRDYVLRRCNQTDAILFDECYPDTVLKNCRKIGEGVYGEVFLWRAGDGRARVMKIVPIAGTIKVNGEHQKDFHEIISEIVIAMELSALRAPIAEIESHFDEGKDVDALDLHSIENATDVFNEVLAVRCVYGNYPSRLLDLWDLFDETKGSENDSPAILPLDQQYIVLELANAGQDLESYQFNSAEQAHALFLQFWNDYKCKLKKKVHDIRVNMAGTGGGPALEEVLSNIEIRLLAVLGENFGGQLEGVAVEPFALGNQVAFGLAVGEESFQFEHRDLHWGNVLIAPSDQKFASFVVRGRAHRVARCGVAATIIDYSLSRLSLPLSTHAAATDSAALYNDLSTDDGLFDARGDYQFEVYRLMRDKLGNDWKNFEPYTNILWLHYTVDKMITALRYKRTNTKIHKHYIAKLKGIRNCILDYGSAAQFVLTDIEF